MPIFYSDVLEKQKEQNLLFRLKFSGFSDQIFKKIDAIPSLTGAGVVFIDKNFTLVELRPFRPICSTKPVKVILREQPAAVKSAQQFANTLSANKRDSHMTGELLGAALSCTGAVLSWMVVIGSGAAIPLTGGASSAVTYLGYAAAAATTAQCVDGAYRVFNEANNPAQNDALDSNEWYVQTKKALDVISLLGVAASASATIKTVLVLKKETDITKVLQGLSRAERRRLTEEIIRLNNPNISNQALKALIRSGAYPSRYSNSQISQAVILQLKDSIAALLSFTGSAMGGEVNSVAVGIYEEIVE